MSLLAALLLSVLSPSSSPVPVPKLLLAPSCIMHSYTSLPLPRSPRFPSLPFLPLPLPLPLPSPPLSHSNPPLLPHSPSTEQPTPPPPSNHVITFLSTLLNLSNRSPTPTPIISFSSSSFYPSLMKSLALSGRPDLSLLLYFSLPSPPSPRLLSSFLHSLRLQQPHLLPSFLPSLISTLLPLSSTSFTILSTFLSHSPDSAHIAFRSIEHPDAIAFGAWIALLCRAGRVNQAVDVFDKMIERRVRPTVRTCTSILKAYCADGRVREAQIFLWAMEHGIGDGVLPRPDVIMYTAYIEGLCLVSAFDLVEKELKQAEEEASTWKPNSVTYDVYISGLCRAGMLAEAFNQVGTMRKKGLQPTIKTLNILFDCLCRDPSTVYKAKDLLERSGELEWEVDSFFYNTLMSRLIEMGQPVSFLKPLTDMVKKGIKPDICSFTILARGLCKAGKFKMAKFIITSPKIEVDVTAYNSLLHELYKVGDFQKQRKLYNEMLDKNVSPNKFTFAMILDSLCKEGKFEEAIKYAIDSLDKRLTGPDLIYRLNKWLVVYGRFQNVLHLLNEMSKKGFLNPPLFNSLINALCWKGYCKGVEFYKISIILDFMLQK
ncbi:Pentatricopeptide repeat-containing protein [Rhynchospora pubera]|uniref:Pentatricopeptide repeat-containing protein n=1 Tax=Rhynchospora pubera TaxID=906938 RepID=A0AAV8EWZ3_9POAL|nr:Pentatricopeptide repeat-containing protein [Rhynchospora pubera]